MKTILIALSILFLQTIQATEKQIQIELIEDNIVIQNLDEAWIKAFCIKHKLQQVKKWPIYITTSYLDLKVPDYKLDHMKITVNIHNYFFVDLDKKLLIIKPKKKT